MTAVKLRAERRAKSGQGIVEYAGSMVISTMMLGGFLAVGPNALEFVFSTVVGSIEIFYVEELIDLPDLPDGGDLPGGDDLPDVPDVL